jgi:predicted acyl esterase
MKKAVALAFAFALSAPLVQAQILASETPQKFEPTNDGFDHLRREVMIPMRDGVKLHTVILVPKGTRSAPMLLTRTPYDASGMTNKNSARLASNLEGYDNATDVIVEGGYIRVVQDIRGKYGSEGDYVMNRPLVGPLNPTKVDHATDTYDTIDWLVKNVPESNGKVGILGISCDGFLPLTALINPHPALKVSVPMNPMVDGWMGDDWFHHGAFRQAGMSYIYNQEATRKNEAVWWTSHADDYDMFMEAGSAGELGKRRGLEQIGFWRKLLQHPAYDAFWQEQAVDKILARQPLKVPLMLVHSLCYFRQEILRPFLDHFLKDDAAKMDVAPVTAFETGTNKWHRLQSWPAGCPSGCTIKPTPLYLNAGLRAEFTAPKASASAFEEYISDPSKPVPFRARPIDGSTWRLWLVDDQREQSGRPDVLTFKSDVLTAPVKISGEPIVNIIASTSGTDSDWVVKVIDLYPDEVAGDKKMGGYQLMISADILRGRYRESFESPSPLKANEPLKYRWALPTANHVFLPGHRITVQIQSSWFPLYDRNPQTFVSSIFFAKPEDYQEATQRVYHAPNQPSSIELPLVIAQ